MSPSTTPVLTRNQRITKLAEAIAKDVKALKSSDGDLSSLTTTAKTNIAAALNEVHALINAKSNIDDTKGDGDIASTWSANKIYDTIEAAKKAVKTDLLAGAGAAFDTFKELQDLITKDSTFAQSLATKLAGKVDFKTAQTLTTAEKKQVCLNIGVGDPDHDFEKDYTTERDK